MCRTSRFSTAAARSRSARYRASTECLRSAQPQRATRPSLKAGWVVARVPPRPRLLTDRYVAARCSRCHRVRRVFERQDHDFTGRELRRLFLHGADMRGGAIYDTRLRGVDLWDIDIHGDLKNVRVNGVDIAPLVEAELERRDPDRAKMRPVDADGF